MLLAIVIQTYLSVANSSNDNAAQSDLQTALTGAKAYYDANAESYSGLSGSFSSVDTGLSSVGANTDSTGPHVVSIDALTGSEVVLVSLGQGSENCWGMVDTTSATAILGKTGPTTLFFEEPAVNRHLAAPCRASSFTAATKPAGVRTSVTGFSSVS